MFISRRKLQCIILGRSSCFFVLVARFLLKVPCHVCDFDEKKGFVTVVTRSKISITGTLLDMTTFICDKIRPVKDRCLEILY